MNEVEYDNSNDQAVQAITAWQEDVETLTAIFTRVARMCVWCIIMLMIWQMHYFLFQIFGIKEQHIHEPLARYKLYQLFG